MLPEVRPGREEETPSWGPQSMKHIYNFKTDSSKVEELYVFSILFRHSFCKADVSFRGAVEFDPTVWVRTNWESVPKGENVGREGQEPERKRCVVISRFPIRGSSFLRTGGTRAVGRGASTGKVAPRIGRQRQGPIGMLRSRIVLWRQGDVSGPICALASPRGGELVAFE